MLRSVTYVKSELEEVVQEDDQIDDTLQQGMRGYLQNTVALTEAQQCVTVDVSFSPQAPEAQLGLSLSAQSPAPLAGLQRMAACAALALCPVDLLPEAATGLAGCHQTLRCEKL